MSDLESKLLMKMTLEDVTLRDVGKTPKGERQFATIGGGRFEGPKLKGNVMPGGSDWMSGRGNGSMVMNGRLSLRTDDGCVIAMRYRGAMDGAPDVLARHSRGEPVDETEYSLRFVTYFETTLYKYGWLNHLVAVGIGHRETTGPVYDVYEIL